jgi:FtsZ-binding cell division protein ZapB
MADAPSQIEAHPAGTVAPTNPDMMKELLSQVKGLSETMAVLRQENESLKETNAKFAEENERVQAAGKRKREAAVDGTIKGKWGAVEWTAAVLSCGMFTPW